MKGTLDASVTYENGEYVLVVHQDDSVVTLFYQSLSVEVHLYNYGEIGHFWVEGYEYLRQLEYRIAILRDKLEYLGPEFCTPTEQKLAMLEQFPPLNYCCYPAVPDQYIVPKDNPWQPSEEAITVMEEFAEEADDKSMIKLLKYYRKHHGMQNESLHSCKITSDKTCTLHRTSDRKTQTRSRKLSKPKFRKRS